MKTRSLEAIADCRMLYFSLRSWMGRKKRCAYAKKAISVPRVEALRTVCEPPYQMTSAIAVEDRISTTG